ncbi:MAG: 23S rRNA (uridine(2552)-2'-O)-methyltransferase RlmE [Sulfuricella sp.]|nr:23S rRNA (uridine(2552)-2'-O)-methyltransferase RlmE [Gammaproteobacteria bacterium]
MKRTKTSKAWMMEHVTDAYVQRAKQEGYRSRASYKLMEIIERDHLLRPGMRVVDLGAAPGGWSQVVAKQLAGSGRVIALDLLEMTPMAGVTFIQGDFREDEVLAGLVKALDGRPVDLVISDMAPNISGIALADQARAMHLAELALEFAVQHLKPGGNFLVKVFQGEGFDEYIRALRRHFRQVVTRKPKASRGRTNETYLLGIGLCPQKS